VGGVGSRTPASHASPPTTLPKISPSTLIVAACRHHCRSARHQRCRLRILALFLFSLSYFPLDHPHPPPPVFCRHPTGPAGQLRKAVIFISRRPIALQHCLLARRKIRVEDLANVIVGEINGLLPPWPERVGQGADAW